MGLQVQDRRFSAVGMSLQREFPARRCFDPLIRRLIQRAESRESWRERALASNPIVADLRGTHFPCQSFKLMRFDEHKRL